MYEINIVFQNIFLRCALERFRGIEDDVFANDSSEQEGIVRASRDCWVGIAFCNPLGTKPRGWEPRKINSWVLKEKDVNAIPRKFLQDIRTVLVMGFVFVQFQKLQALPEF
jgi:hypothetical protein